MVRVKHRYLLINILYPARNPKSNDREVPSLVRFHQPSPPDFESSDLKRLILSSVSTLFGEYGVGVVQGSLQVKYFSPATSTAIIRVARAHYRIIWAGLTGISRLPNPHNHILCVVSVVRVSGTMKKAEECAIKIAKDMIRRVHGSVADAIALSEAAEGQMEIESENENDGDDDSSAESEDEDIEVDTEIG